MRSDSKSPGVAQRAATSVRSASPSASTNAGQARRWEQVADDERALGLPAEAPPGPLSRARRLAPLSAATGAYLLLKLFDSYVNLTVQDGALARWTESAVAHPARTACAVALLAFALDPRRGAGGSS